MATGPAYRVLSARLEIRCYQLTDAPAMRDAVISSLDHLRPTMPWAWDEPKPIEDHYARLRRFRSMFDTGADFIYGAFERDTGRLIGGTGLHPRVGPEALEIGYWVRADATRRGYATEMAGALTRVGFEVEGVDHIEIRIVPENIGSLRIPTALGYTREGVLRRRITDRDGHPSRDAVVFLMTREEYPGSPAARHPLLAFDGLGEPLL